MTRNEAIAIAKTRHAEVCRAEWAFWTNGGTEPNRRDYGFHHGWFQIEGYSIGSDEYAPGPTYDFD